MTPHIHKFSIGQGIEPQSALGSSLNQTFMRDNQPTSLSKNNNSPLNISPPTELNPSPQQITSAINLGSPNKYSYASPSHTPLLSKNTSIPTKVNLMNKHLVQKGKTTTTKNMVNTIGDGKEEMSTTVKEGLFYGSRVS